MAAVRRALREVVDPADVELAWRALVAQAAEGDPLAAREVLDRTLGKGAIPSEATAEYDLSSAGGCVKAMSAVAKAVEAGDMTLDEAEAMTRVVARAARIHEGQNAKGVGEGVGVLVAPAGISAEEWIARATTRPDSAGTETEDRAGGVIPSPPELAGDVPPRK
jgi:hypothetical protein